MCMYIYHCTLCPLHIYPVYTYMYMYSMYSSPNHVRTSLSLSLSLSLLPARHRVLQYSHVMKVKESLILKTSATPGQIPARGQGER